MNIRLLTLPLLALAAVGAHANLVVNGDFESTPPAAANSWYATQTIPAWTYVGPTNGDVAVIGVGYLGAPTQELDLSGGNDIAGSGLQQSLATNAGWMYQVTFDVYTGWPGYSGGVNLDWDGGSVASSLQGMTSGNGRMSYSYLLTASTAATMLQFTSDGRGPVAHIDNVSVEAVPEPGTLAGLAAGAVALIRRRRRARA